MATLALIFVVVVMIQATLAGPSINAGHGQGSGGMSLAVMPHEHGGRGAEEVPEEIHGDNAEPSQHGRGLLSSVLGTIGLGGGDDDEQEEGKHGLLSGILGR